MMVVREEMMWYLGAEEKIHGFLLLRFGRRRRRRRLDHGAEKGLGFLVADGWDFPVVV